MREVVLKVYSFNELSKDAQKKAIEEFEHLCYEVNSNNDWEDACKTEKRVKEIAKIQCDIQMSSQGFYCKWYKDVEHNGKTDKELWEEFKSNMQSFEENYWCDADLLDILKDFIFSENQSYELNVVNLLIDFNTKIYEITCSYYEEESIREFILDMDYEFYEDGSEYVPIHE